MVFSASDDDVDIYIDGVFNSAQSLENNITTEFDKITLVSNAADTGYYSYFGSYYLGNSIVEAMNTYNSIGNLLTTTYDKTLKSQSLQDFIKWAVSQTGYIITFNNDETEMNIDDKFLRITAVPKLQSDTSKWKPVLIQK